MRLSKLNGKISFLILLTTGQNTYYFIMEFLSPFIDFLNAHAVDAHWWIFGALILAGFNVPISEDLMLITSGVLASTVVPENTYKLFIAVFLGCYLSDWIAYWLGRILGGKLLEMRWFAKSFKKDRLAQIRYYYQSYGFLTLLFGRFIPFGIRNCLFITAGLSKMHFGKFLISDGIACITSNTVLFCLAYSFGKNSHILIEYVSQANIMIFSLFAMAISGSALYFYFNSKKYATSEGAEQ
ncbi:Uncharacterized protein SCG7109_AD_00340 [Chlamydiales bacterium SCGC AG-110-M15]|nr:Uncharacterized protein SCG7109_AD_00340 [Chlamydiales bacterium SCGC AG-110-M15]